MSVGEQGRADVAKPSFQRMWSAFPTHASYRTMGDLYRHLGGNAQQNINAQGFGENGNACASRISVALNAAGAPINTRTVANLRLRTVGTARGQRIIFSVAELRRYLEIEFGRPNADTTRPVNDMFAGKKGILAMSVSGWSNATGHIALWDGTAFREAATAEPLHQSPLTFTICRSV